MFVSFVIFLARKLRQYLARPSGYIRSDKRPWPWLRRFLYLWLYLFLYWGFTMLLDAYGMSPLTHRYAYGLIRFWFFYLPVFGLMMQSFYSTYDGLGVWTPGLSYVTGLRAWLRDLFDR